MITSNIRFINIQKEIDLKLITGLNQVIFFDEFKIKDEFYKEHKEKDIFIPIADNITDKNDEINTTNNTTNNNIKDNESSFNISNNNNNDILSKKINSLINYYVNYF